MGNNAGNIHLDAAQIAIGNVIAGSSAYKLSVTGKIICEELKVKLVSSGWPDYVFDKKYKLPSLAHVEKYINENKHLPNIPSAAEVEKNGIEVGDAKADDGKNRRTHIICDRSAKADRSPKKELIANL